MFKLKKEDNKIILNNYRPYPVIQGTIESVEIKRNYREFEKETVDQQLSNYHTSNDFDIINEVQDVFLVPGRRKEDSNLLVNSTKMFI